MKEEKQKQLLYSKPISTHHDHDTDALFQEASLRSSTVKATLLRVKGNLAIMGISDKGLIRRHHQTKKKKETVRQPIKLINLTSF